MPFSHIDNWVFDLDDTLYDHDNGIWEQINQRISAYIKQHLHVDDEEVARLRRHFYQFYGGALKGLLSEYRVDTADYLANVHDVDYSVLKPNMYLAKAIAALPGRELIFTNGDRPHAERTLQRLGLLDVFDDIFDTVAADFEPKPHKIAYDKFLQKFAIAPHKTVMVEDNLANLCTCKELGMTTAFIGKSSRLDGIAYVDYHADKVDIFMEKVLESFNG